VNSDAAGGSAGERAETDSTVDSAGDSAEESDGYVHRPDDWEESESDDDADDLGIGGWLLVGIVAVAFLVIPGIIYLFPAAPGEAGLSFLVAMLALPFAPALLLGAVAVWSAVADGEQ
jgi:hypothetical protein